MNLIKFLKEVDMAVKCSSAEDLASFIHDYARTLPDVKREEFLKRLSGMGMMMINLYMKTLRILLVSLRKPVN